ncbi:ABC transporter ATP-binding protein [Paenibacillus sp. JNUCC31]|uniref:ABC transporter ATP-binding protein n=1 Tax=Paenibacillus sp. JNUCC-31 TaxID=2777983 RepID=UPI001E3B9F20|nr:ATP-binding cassette domain-containing protein [Paenibacillus sp. JNUCC-31]
MENVSKEFTIYKREKGLWNSVKSIVKRDYVTKTAVNNISFNINKGEMVGYIGANGAGKSTTIKMLSGVLVPSSGTVNVAGRIPYKDRKNNAKIIGVVFGQRTQLYWSLPIEETFELYKKIYKIPDKVYQQNVEFYIELLDLHEFIDVPVRQLSLGQKMRAELAVSLLHDPQILYLDEPTIGLDVVVKQKIRHFIREINKDKQTTVILTTHDMDDIEQICDRIITIDKGNKIFDGSLSNFKEVYGAGHTIIVEFQETNVQLQDSRLTIYKEENAKKWIKFDEKEISVAEAISSIARNHNIVDISLKEPSVEDAVQKIYGN